MKNNTMNYKNKNCFA